ncbi:MAG TPA: hypothetical protein VIM19_00445 [Actinomycetes bacterium]
MNKTLLRKTVVGGVALLSLGVASPAFATGGTTTPTSTAGAVTTVQSDSTLTVDQLKAKVTAKITARQAALTAKLAALPTVPTAQMTADEIKAKQDLISILQTKLTDLQAAVNAASTVADVQTALANYWAPSLTELQARINVMITHQLAELDEKIAKLPTSKLDATQQAAATAALTAQKDKLTQLQTDVKNAQSVAQVQTLLKAAGIGDGRHKKQHDGEHSWPMDTKHGKKDQGRHGGGLGLGLGQGLGNLGGFGGHDSGQAGHGH